MDRVELFHRWEPHAEVLLIGVWNKVCDDCGDNSG
jgi:hypothetical protein